MLPASVKPSLRVVRCRSCAPSRVSSSCTFRLTVVFGNRKARAAETKLPCSTTFAKISVSLRSRFMDDSDRLLLRTGGLTRGRDDYSLNCRLIKSGPRVYRTPHVNDSPPSSYFEP